MKQEELNVHGSMFFLLKRFIESTYSKDMWENISSQAGTTKASYNPTENYPAAEMFSILSAASAKTGLNENELKEKFGEYMVPDLLHMYGSYLNPQWRTFELLQNTELVMHKAVRKEQTNASPPVLNIARVHDKLIIIDYYSKRKMASLAVGIIKGIAKYYKESDLVHVVPTTDPHDERVQIRIEFV
jgi:hypothetical protein